MYVCIYSVFITVTVTVTDCVLKHELQKSTHFPPSCPGSYADLFRAPLHEVLPKRSPPLHVLESGGIPDMVSQQLGSTDSCFNQQSAAVTVTDHDVAVICCAVVLIL
jgi:hypothetical protein